eukprot:gene7372-5307_t
MASFLLCEYGFSVATLFPSYRAYIESRHSSSGASQSIVESLLSFHDLPYPDHLAAESSVTSDGSTVTTLTDALAGLQIEGPATETPLALKDDKGGKKHKVPSTKKGKKMSSARKEPVLSDEA